MTNDMNTGLECPETGDTDLSRRMLMSAMAGGLSLLGLASAGCANAREASSQDAEPPIFNAYERKKSFVNGEMDGTPWVATQTGNFDLEDPLQNRLALLKMSNNLVGARTYIPMLTRIMLAREDQSGGRLLGSAGMFTWQLQVPDPKDFPNVPEGTALMRSMFTAVYLDPETMEPVKELRNPYNGKMMELEDYLFTENFLNFPKGGSLFIEEPQFANDSPDKEDPKLFRKWGDELVLFNGGVYKEPGAHQPRFTENIWASAYDKVMDPDADRIDMRYSFMGVNKAFEKPWAGYSTADEDLFMSLAYGRKVHRPEDLPDLHKRVMADRYPDRL